MYIIMFPDPMNVVIVVIFEPFFAPNMSTLNQRLGMSAEYMVIQLRFCFKPLRTLSALMGGMFGVF